MASITTRIQLPSDHRKKKSLCLPTSDSRVRFWCVMVNGEPTRSKLRRISKAKSSIISCIGHKYVYVYELGCRIVVLKSWYPYFFGPVLPRPQRSCSSGGGRVRNAGLLVITGNTLLTVACEFCRRAPNDFVCPRGFRVQKMQGSDSSHRARDMAATMLDHSRHRGESATKTVKFFAVHTVNCYM